MFTLLIVLAVSTVVLAALTGWGFISARQCRQALRAECARWEALLQLERMTDADVPQLIDAALAAAVRLTESRAGSLALLDESASAPSVHTWPEASANGVAEVDKLNCHLEVPIFAGEQNVAVAAVGRPDPPYVQADVQQLTLLMQATWRLIQRNRANQRGEHLKALVSAIRNVNQLISREKDAQHLLAGACQAMVDQSVYRSVWIGRLDESRTLMFARQAGDEGRFDTLTERFQQGRGGERLERVVSRPEVTLVADVAWLWTDPGLSQPDQVRPALAVRLEYQQRIYGVLVAELAARARVDAEEESLVKEIAGDLGAALHSLELEGERQRAEQSLRLERSRLEALLQLGQMTEASLQQITDFALEEAVRLTQSRIGYLAFMNEDESVLTMHSWSKSAMSRCRIIDKPIVYPMATTGLWGEAVRQRKPVITNDYAAPSPYKRGYPEGHVPMDRHMNVPVFDGERIVAVAGVGNKDQPYDESDVRQLTLLAQGMWRLLQRKQAEQELHAAREELELRVRERTAALAAANEELQHERYLLHTLMDELPHAIYFKDIGSRFIRINRALARAFGLSDPADAAGKTDLDFFAAEHANRAITDEQQILLTGRPIVDLEEQETWPDGRSNWVLTTKMPWYDETGRIAGTFGLSRDITEQKQAAQSLHAAKEAAEAANLAKSTFLANMSHEIRTPLNAVIGMSELVLDTELSPQQQEFLTIVKDSGEALLSVINDILDFSKVEAGKLTLERVPFDLWEHVGDTMKSFGARAHRQGLELACRIHPDVPRRILGDFTRLRQIIVNLVGNAIKFTEEGEVVLDVGCESRTGGRALLHFTVSDTGIGIPRELQPAIFEMFQQADSSPTRRHGGTGLGLSICDRLVALMDGRIWVESEVGQGSRFHFTLRLELAGEAAAAAPPGEPECLHGLRALVVDDNATNRRILDEVLRGWQLVPTQVPGVEAALEELRRAQQTAQPFRLLLTDVHMPHLDGFALVERIQADPALRNTLIIMLTSGDRPEDLTRCQELKVAAYLLKPVKQSELFDAILNALGIGEVLQRQPSAPATAAPRRRPLNILLAEDSLVNQKLATSLLQRQGHQVRVVNNGREALAALASSQFELILMDIQMPEMDGLEATRQIRALEQGCGRRTPILAMTAHALKGDRQRCLETGMDGYIAKPVRAQDLLRAIDEVLPC